MFSLCSFPFTTHKRISPVFVTELEKPFGFQNSAVENLLAGADGLVIRTEDRKFAPPLLPKAIATASPQTSANLRMICVLMVNPLSELLIDANHQRIKW